MGRSINLTWPFHTKTFLDGIWYLFQKEYRTDFQLTVNSAESSERNISYVNAHRLILAIFCPNVVKHPQSNQFCFQDLDVDEDVLKSLLNLIYRGKVSVDEQRLDKLKTGAEILGIKTIVELVDSYFAREEATRLKKELKISRGTRKRKGKPYKIFKRIKKPINSNVKVMSELHLTESPSEVVKTGAEMVEVDSDPNSGQNEEEECSRADSDTSDYSAKPKQRVGSRTEKLKWNLWSRTSSAALERLRPRSYAKAKKKRKRMEKEESHVSTAFDVTRKQYVCKFCDKGFSTKDRHARHVRCHENPDNLQKCVYCEYKTVEKYVLIQHLASKHHVDRDGKQLTRDIKCSDCSFTCVSNFQLKNHKLQKHSSKQFKCEECGHLFGKKALRDRHVLAKHRNERPYMCETCGHRAKTLNAFKSHLELHSGKKFVCDVCGLALTLSCSLKRHMKLHLSNERPFPCHLCSFATRKRYNLRVHLRNVHKLEMDSLGNVKGKLEAIAPSINHQSSTQLPVTALADHHHHSHHHQPPLVDSALCIPELDSVHHIF